MAGTLKSSYSTQQFAMKIRSYGTAVGKAQRVAVHEAAMMLKQSIERQTSIATKGSMGFSRMDTRVTRSGAVVRRSGNSKLRVGFDVVGDAHPTALLVARGPWGLIEYGSVPHEIIPRLESISRRGPALARQRALTQRRLDIAFGATGVFNGVSPLSGNAGGGEPRYRVKHPGTKGKKPFHTGVMMVRDRAARRALGIISNQTIRTIRKGRTTWQMSSSGDILTKTDFGSMGTTTSFLPGRD
jgi:hypothetical protein